VSRAKSSAVYVALITIVGAAFIGALAVIVLPPLFYSKVVIYDNLPVNPISLPSTIQFSVENKSPVILLQASPSYYLTVGVESNSSSLECMFVFTFRGDTPCSSSSLSLGAIAPRQPASATIRVSTAGNFTLRVNVFMDYFIQKNVASEVIACTTVPGTAQNPFGPTYKCSETYPPVG
jgi:hypothetical protein